MNDPEPGDARQLLQTSRASPRFTLTNENEDIPIWGLSSMKKPTFNLIAASAVFCASLMLSACTTSETTYSSNPYPYYGTTYTYGPAGETTYAYNGPVETTTTTTTAPPSDSVVGSTANAAGSIIAAPFRIVGDALGVIF